MNLFFWFLKFIWLVGLIVIGNQVSAAIGMWSIPICIAAFLAGNALINRWFGKKKQ
ncbi:hypothetical protein [Neobacillus sp. Marseille-QA0830]